MSEVLRTIKRLIPWLHHRYMPQNHTPPGPFGYFSGPAIQIKLSNAILWFSVGSLFLLTSLKKSDTSEGFTSLHVFVICIMFSFISAFSVQMIRNNPNQAALRKFYFQISIFSMGSALSVLAYVLLSESFFRWGGLNKMKV